MVDVRDLEKAAFGGSLDIDLEGDPQELLGVDLEEIRFAGPFRVRLRLLNQVDSIEANGKIAAGIKLECNRCLREFSYSLERNFRLEYYKKRLLIRGGEVELKEEDLAKVYYQGEIIDFRDEVRNEVILGIPIKPLCASDCLGLCPVCGQDLNEKRCNCQTDVIDKEEGGRIKGRKGRDCFL